MKTSISLAKGSGKEYYSKTENSKDNNWQAPQKIL
jgi:hypothetical protein